MFRLRLRWRPRPALDRADSDADAVSRVLDAASDITGATGAAAAAVALLGAGGPGAIAAAGGGAIFISALREISHRTLSHREQARIGAAWKSFWPEFEERLAAGDQLRADGWFDDTLNGQRRSAAAEICEGVLLAAQRQHQERKVEFYGYLLANLCFDPSIDVYLANWLLALADQLTWLQLVLLAMVGRKDEFNVPDIEVGQSPQDWTPWGVHQQLADLGYGRREMILAPGAVAQPGRVTFPRIDLRLRAIELSGSGLLLYAGMSLDRVPRSDVESVIDLLSQSGGPSG